MSFMPKRAMVLAAGLAPFCIAWVLFFAVW